MEILKVDLLWELERDGPMHWNGQKYIQQCRFKTFLII